MERYTSFDGIGIAYAVSGDGPTALLLHGFAADADRNWVHPGVVDALVGSGRRVVAYDARGHGQSDKPHDTEAYAGDAMVRDAMGLLDHLGIDVVDIVGYSMGSMISSRVASADGRVRSVVLGGIGAGGANRLSPEGRAAIADALTAEDPATIEAAAPRAFRAFADSTGADRQALAAIQRAPRNGPAVSVEGIKAPLLVITGDRDALVGSPDDLA